MFENFEININCPLPIFLFFWIAALGLSRFEDTSLFTTNIVIADWKVMDSSDIFATASQDGEEEYEEELSAAEVVFSSTSWNLLKLQSQVNLWGWSSTKEPILKVTKLSLFKVLAKLEEAWINERNAPELLHPRMEMV